MRQAGKDDATCRNYDLLFHPPTVKAARKAVCVIDMDRWNRYSDQYCVGMMCRRINVVCDFALDEGQTMRYLCEWHVWHKINNRLITKWPYRRRLGNDRTRTAGDTGKASHFRG